MITTDLRSSFLGLRLLGVQAPVPYLNRALAEEQLGVDADEHNEHQEAQMQYSEAVEVSLCCLCVNAVAREYIEHFRLGHLAQNLQCLHRCTACKLQYLNNLHYVHN